MPADYGPPLILRSKVVLLGDAQVGKTALREVAATNNFPRNYNVTLSPELSVKSLPIPDRNVTVELHLHEPGAQESSKDLNKTKQLVCQDATAFILCYDATNNNSFQNLEGKWSGLVMNSDLPKTGVVVAGKCGGRQAVPSTLGRDWASSHQFEYFELPQLELQNPLPDQSFQSPFEFIAAKTLEKYEQRVNELKAMGGGSFGSPSGGFNNMGMNQMNNMGNNMGGMNNMNMGINNNMNMNMSNQNFGNNQFGGGQPDYGNFNQGGGGGGFQQGYGGF